MTVAPLESLCQQLPACILQQTASQLTLAVAAVPSTEIIEALRFASQRQVCFECWPLTRIQQHRREHPLGFLPASTDHSLAAIPQQAEQLLIHAIHQRASDIHIDPVGEGVRIRLRIDGLLYPFPLTQPCPGEALVSRFKIMAGMDIAETRRPQDGKLNYTSEQHIHSFRLATLPTQYGEKLVLRRQHPSDAALTLEQLGLSASEVNDIRQLLLQPQGMILVTGPTGSGKTVTLYSLLNALNTPQRNLTSAEDPIEIPLAGVNQTQVNSKAGLDFACILRALLRQDPDVIMIGEIRDNETADIAVKAAQTGHLVFSTLHTNSTTEAIIRLRQMGIPGYLLAASLKLVIAQRLVRKLCPHCRRLSEAPLLLPASISSAPQPHWQACGCDHCFGGYFGRLGLFELLPISGELHQAIAADCSPATLTEIALRQGMRSLAESGLEAVKRGETSWSEILRVTGGVNDELSVTALVGH